MMWCLQIGHCLAQCPLGIGTARCPSDGHLRSHWDGADLRRKTGMEELCPMYRPHSVGETSSKSIGIYTPTHPPTHPLSLFYLFFISFNPHSFSLMLTICSARVDDAIRTCFDRTFCIVSSSFLLFKLRINSSIRLLWRAHRPNSIYRMLRQSISGARGAQRNR